jgi:hypothetical protein
VGPPCSSRSTFKLAPLLLGTHQEMVEDSSRHRNNIIAATRYPTPSNSQHSQLTHRQPQVAYTRWYALIPPKPTNKRIASRLTRSLPLSRQPSSTSRASCSSSSSSSGTAVERLPCELSRFQPALVLEARPANNKLTCPQHLRLRPPALPRHPRPEQDRVGSHSTREI